jgi:glycerol kinase
MGETRILAIDQGTTSNRAVMYDAGLRPLASSQQEFPQIFPRPGWVEHDAAVIWQSVLDVCRDVIDKSGTAPADIASIGITNQRETTVLWDRTTGEPIGNAIVWQDRRTAERCRELEAHEDAGRVAARTGLRLDPYFSATKIAWLLDHTDGARARAEAGDLAFGTIDSFLLWNLTGGRVHATDVTNASRTALFDIHEQRWDERLLALFDVPAVLLPGVLDCAADFGRCDPSLFGAAIPIGGIAGDQQAALFGQACLSSGMTKSTYGTGCFVIANTGDRVLASHNQLLSTIAYRLDGRVTYGLEGSIFVAGSAVQWLRDGLGVIGSAADTASIAAAHGVEREVYVVPAFTGLGAPHWDPDARGAIFGLTRGAGVPAIVTATLQSVAFQTADLLRAMRDDGVAADIVRVDGGMAANDWFLQFLADATGTHVQRPANTESTVTGAAALAALQAGLFDSPEAVTAAWALEREFDRAMPEGDVAGLLAGWRDAVARVGSLRRV